MSAIKHHYDFKTTTHAKWIITGEHAVLRDNPAIVFPLHNRIIALFYQKTDEPLSLDTEAQYAETYEQIIWGLLDDGLKHLNKNVQDLQGDLYVENNIPIAAGLGFSSALSVSFTRWLIHLGLLSESDLFEFSKKLDDRFHGYSSGIDIHGVLADQGLKFQKGEVVSEIQPEWEPCFSLSYSNRLSMTSKCLQKIDKFWETDPKQARKIDEAMNESTQLVEKALTASKNEGYPLLKEAIHKARHCHEQWDLMHGNLVNHMKELEQLGAEAVKPVGAGDGGYVLALWHETLPKDTPFEMIPVSLKR